MVMFSSRPPFNDDPKPIHVDGRGVGPSLRFSEEDAPWAQPWMEVAMHRPRPEFDRPQHNPTNPILAAHREGLGDAWGLAQCVGIQINLGGLPEWKDENAALHLLTTASRGQLRHARKVLERLARLS